MFSTIFYIAIGFMYCKYQEPINRKIRGFINTKDKTVPKTKDLKSKVEEIKNKREII